MSKKKKASRKRTPGPAPEDHRGAAALRAGGGPIIYRATGGPIIYRAGGGPIIFRSAGFDSIPAPDLGMSSERFVAGGWLPDLPDRRDLTINSDVVRGALTQRSGRSRSSSRTMLLSAARTLPPKVDLRPLCPPIEDQKSLGSCTANAAIGLMEYLQMQSGESRRVDLSRLFLYKTTRRLMGVKGDTGAYIRTTIKAAASFGVPPEQYWPYHITKFDVEPDAFLYSFAANYKSLNYTRLDQKNFSGKETLDAVKRTLADGFPVVFGFTVYSSMGGDADIPYPGANDREDGGHAVLAVGYDDDRPVINGASANARGALIIRNSWGTAWGDEGYGYLPYDYVREQLALDFWTIFKQEWIDVRAFDEV